jgi:hypothetical protein
MVRSLALERDRETQRAEEHQRRAEEQRRRAEELRVEMLRLQLELERFKKWYCGPRADRLQSSGEMAQMLLAFAADLDRKPVHPKGRRNLADFENLPVTTHVHELGAEERACPCCGAETKEIGAEESWHIEHYPARFERIQYLRKKYACPNCDSTGDGAQIQTAANRNPRLRRGWPGRDSWLTS